MKILNNYIGKRSGKKYRTWFLIKETKYGTGIVALSNVMFPEHLIGRKVRFRLEIIEPKKEVNKKLMEL